MMKSTKKKLIKRSVSFLTALVMSFGYVASPDLVNEVKDGVTRTTSFLRAYAAADNPYFKKWDDLQAYAEAYTADNQNDTIYIQCNAGMDIPSDFVGIGTSDAPFKGQIIIQNVSDDNGGDSARIHLNSPLFNYISDEATITDTNNNNCTLYLYPDTMGDRPLFARYVAGTGGSANWKIKVNEVADVDNNSSQINARSSLIGEIYNKTAEPDITISYYNQFAEISGNDNLGVICNTLRDGKLTVSFPEDADGINVPSITTTNGNVGGIVGEMGSGTELKINSTINMTSSRIISTGDGYAGGLVGKCLGTVEFDTDTSYSDNNSTSITGSSAAGGVFGYFEVDDDIPINISDYCLTTVQDANAPGEGIKATSANSAVGGFIGKLVNNGTDDNVVSITITGGDSIAESPTINSTLSATESESNGGGLIGLYYTESLKNSLLIDHINLTSGGIKVGKYYGGIIGKTESNYNCGAYVRINDVTVNSNYFHSIDQYKLNIRSSGLVCSMENDFIDISGLVTLTGRVHAGIIFDSPSGVVRLAGTTDLSGLTIDNGMLVTNRNNTLIYALGSGSDYDSENQTGWTYKRTGVANATALDDINPWGQVVRYVSTTVGGTTNSETIEAASVVDVDVTNHTVTLQDASLNMASSADFAKTALNIQLNTTGEDFGALQFASDSNTSSSLLEDELTISNSFNLAGTGITGLTRDNEGSESINGSIPFTGTLISSGNNTITLAIGEAYGYKGSTLAQSVSAGDGNKNTGAIIDHTLNGLFAKLGNCTIGTSGNPLTLNGNIIASSASTHYIGGLAAQLYDGTATINNIKCKETIDVNGGGTKRIGMLIGEVLRTTHKETINNAETTVIDGDPISLSIDTLEMAGTVNVVSTKACVGLIGRISDSTLDATFDNVTLKGTIDYTGADRPYAGGLIGATSATTGYSRNVTLNNVNVNGLSVSTTMTGNSSISNKFENPAGGLLGGQWLNTNVIWGSKTDTDKSVKITSGTLVLSGNSSFAGGLVANATGYWQVNDIDVTAMTITGANDGIGVLVLNGKNTTDNTTYGLYLEMTSLGAYSLPNDFKVTDDAPAVAYDEVMAFSKGISTITKKVEGTDTTVIVPSENNGQAIISIHTSNIDGVPKLSMDSNTENSYSPKSILGATHNPFARYYYNLDYLLPNASTGGEKLLLWSVYQYAMGNIKNNSKIQSEHVGSNNTTYGFSSYNTFPAANSTCDLANLSYYPVDISDTVTISSGITVKFYNSEMQAAHGNTYDLNGVGSKSNNSQHYLMHAGLFKDIKRSLTINSMTLQGNISSHGISDAEDLAAGSGAIACGTVQGSTGSIINVRIDDLTLDGIMVNMNSGIDALMVEKVGGNVAFTIKDVKTSSSGYSSYSASDYAANYLIGDAEGSSMTFNFSEMILDGRTTDNSSTIYNPSATSGTAKELNDAYHTSKSIFKEATFFKSLKYAKGSGSSAKYNYDWSEDWGTTKHQVTYGKEISETAENIKVISGNNVSQQTRYADRKASSGGLEYYTSPESDSLTSAPYDFSDFIPHVKEPYDKDNNYHEVAINLVNAVIESGCGTYNDPYIIDDGERLETIAKALNDTTDTSGFSKGFYLFINAEYANLGTKINYFSKGDNKDKDRWCDAGEDYKFVYDDAQSDKTKKFVYTYVENGTTKYKYLSVQDVKNYLAGAYYYIDGNITLSSSFVGLGGNSTTNAFRGVIVGGQITDGENTSYPIITNNSEFPLVKKSNGSVIKNVTIHIAPEDDISLTANTKNAFAYSEDSNSVQYYGGVIGEIMGGDNIIDNVPVIFQNNKNVIIDDSTAYFNDIPVGAYVGVIVNGSLMFRKMTSDMTSTDTTGFHAYLSSDTSKSITLESDVQFNQDGTETITNLYVNPIIGRVLNGFAINETDTYR
ncbi:hypothetical protein [Ruminococcus sp.]|uniref:hypothetical protein n=1 Tax=Ruminococcus sp. TaxID=41978 RepID=UPI002588C426|nr:hypothetical protein [Ruminococcus sp.]MCR5021789.1 hypothetical protein [Ruminococcus sp.]